VCRVVLVAQAHLQTPTAVHQAVLAAHLCPHLLAPAARASQTRTRRPVRRRTETRRNVKCRRLRRPTTKRRLRPKSQQMPSLSKFYVCFNLMTWVMLNFLMSLCNVGHRPLASSSSVVLHCCFHLPSAIFAATRASNSGTSVKVVILPLLASFS